MDIRPAAKSGKPIHYVWKLIGLSSVIMACICLPLRGAEPQTPAEWVEALASPNPEPKIEQRDVRAIGRYTLPDGFDKEAQKRVVRAWDHLAGQGVAAFPALIEHLNDERYSTSIASPISEYWHNWSVGQVSKRIIESQIETWGPYSVGKGDPRSRPPRPHYCAKDFEQKKSVEVWWKAHQDKSLRDIQIEALEWTIAEEKKQDADKYAADILYLNDLLSKLQNSVDPLKSKSVLYRLGGNTGR
jgi:hypothetical protein